MHLGINLLLLADPPGKCRWLEKKLPIRKGGVSKPFQVMEKENRLSLKMTILLEKTVCYGWLDEQKHDPSSDEVKPDKEISLI